MPTREDVAICLQRPGLQLLAGGDVTAGRLRLTAQTLCRVGDLHKAAHLWPRLPHTDREQHLLRVARVQLGGRLGLDLGWLVSELGVAVFVFAGVAARAVQRAALWTFPDTAHRSPAQVGEERLELPSHY